LPRLHLRQVSPCVARIVTRRAMGWAHGKVRDVKERVKNFGRKMF
jgi:hypothetical protein